jgi:uncharacterized protein (DUF433 family)
VAQERLNELRRTPAYSLVEAAHYLGMPVATLRAWCLGRGYRTSVGVRKQAKPLILLDGNGHQGLSFLNLVEAHVLGSMRRQHKVSLHAIRRALGYVADRMAVERPLLSQEFVTDGVSLFVENLGELLNVSHAGQLAMQEVMRAYLHRIERDSQGLPVRLFPFTRQPGAYVPEKPGTVVMDPRIAFGRPVLKGRAVPTSVLADRFKAGDSLSELAGDYECSVGEIEEALRCEIDRRQAA